MTNPWKFSIGSKTSSFRLFGKKKHLKISPTARRYLPGRRHRICRQCQCRQRAGSGKTPWRLRRLKGFLLRRTFRKNFLTLESRTIFDLIDKGQDIIDKTKTDVIIWGYREGDKIRLNFQTDKQYEYEDKSFVSLLDSLYIPAVSEANAAVFPKALLNLIHGAVISAVTPPDTETRIYRRYLLKKSSMNWP